MMPMSPGRNRVLEYCQDYYQQHGYMPTHREIGAAVGLRSPSTVHHHLIALEKTGYIKAERRKNARTRLAVAVNTKDAVRALADDHTLSLADRTNQLYEISELARELADQQLLRK